MDEIARETEKADKLLYQILPKSVARKLLKGKPVRTIEIILAFDQIVSWNYPKTAKMSKNGWISTVILSLLVATFGKTFVEILGGLLGNFC